MAKATFKIKKKSQSGELDLDLDLEEREAGRGEGMSKPMREHAWDVPWGQVEEVLLTT